MNAITVNHNSEMLRHLVSNTDVFRDNPITIVDVGARWGFNSEWAVFGEHLMVYCFEPDEDECRTLNEKAGRNVRYIPRALARQSGNTVIYETRIRAGSGLYETNMQFFSRLLNRENNEVVARHDIKTTTLDEAVEEYKISGIDFLKLDVEGAEMDVLIGGERCVQSSRLCGILSEFRFQEEINGCPIFWELDAHVRKFGFRIFGMQFTHQSRIVLPYESLADYVLPGDTRIFAYTKHGQIMDGDALYFRDLLIPANTAIRAQQSPAQILKMAAFYELYSLNDCAAELILAHRDRLEPIVDCDHLLDLLTPPVKQKKIKYERYMSHYFSVKGLFSDSSQDSVSTGNAASNSLDVEKLRAELQRVYASWSWRITKPLRGLKSILNRVRNDR